MDENGWSEPDHPFLGFLGFRLYFVVESLSSQWVKTSDPGTLSWTLCQNRSKIKPPEVAYDIQRHI
jgi:hypothetical protein